MKTILTFCSLLCSLFVCAQTADTTTISLDNNKMVTSESKFQSDFMNVFVAPDRELIVIQLRNINTQDLDVTLMDANNKEIKRTKLYQASTIAFFETQTLYSGDYVIKISDEAGSICQKISLNK